MIKKCLGCGVILQNERIDEKGYVPDMEMDKCQRCFKMSHYGIMKKEIVEEKQIKEMIESINQSQDLVVYVVDSCQIFKDYKSIRQQFNNPLILVLTKIDLLPRNLDKQKWLGKVNNIDEETTILISSYKNINLDLLMTKINHYKKSENVYLVGSINSGKSSLLNALIKEYSNNVAHITESYLPNTTLDQIEIKIDNSLTLIDTPGFVDSENILNYLTGKNLKNTIIKKEMKPRIFQVKEKISLLIDEIMRLDVNSNNINSLVWFISNGLIVRRVNYKNELLKDKIKRTIKINKKEDLVINGLGFITFENECEIDLYIDERVGVFTRKSIIKR